MTTQEFQTDVLAGARKLLKNKTVTAKRLSDAAKSALSLSEQHSRSISIKDLSSFLGTFPEYHIFFKKKWKKPKNRYEGKSLR